MLPVLASGVMPTHDMVSFIDISVSQSKLSKSRSRNNNVCHSPMAIGESSFLNLLDAGSESGMTKNRFLPFAVLRTYAVALLLRNDKLVVLGFQNPIVWQPRRVHESGAGSPCCLSARMCEFMATPLSGVRRGNPDFSRDAKREGRPFFGSFLWTSKEMNKSFLRRSEIRRA